MKYTIAIVFVSGLISGCATPKAYEPESVAPGEKFEGNYINVNAPQSEGWKLAQSSNEGLAFFKGGQKSNESFAAQIMKFNLPEAKTPEAFEALIRSSVEADIDENRFKIQSSSIHYTAERSYPCVRYNSIVQDKAPAGASGPLLLEASALYCQHPVHKETAFSVAYSHRGESLYGKLHEEAEQFIQGVQVPGK